VATVFIGLALATLSRGIGELQAKNRMNISLPLNTLLKRHAIFMRSILENGSYAAEVITHAYRPECQYVGFADEIVAAEKKRRP
jgi:hypothetical protein